MSSANPNVLAYLHADGHPDWDFIEFDVLCPQCQYNLRTLTSPRCPECGCDLDWLRELHTAATRAGVHAFLYHGRPLWDAIRFDVRCGRCNADLCGCIRAACPSCRLPLDWTEVLGRARSDTFDLYEHAPASRLVRAWCRSVVRALRPVQFWRGMSLYSRINTRRLRRMILIAVIVFWPAWFVLGGCLSLAADAFSTYPQATPGPARFIRYVLESLGLNPRRDEWSVLIAGLAPAWILVASMVSVCGLRQTLGRCRIRTDQVLRVAAYSAAPICIAWLAVLAGGQLCSRGEGYPYLFDTAPLPRLFAMYIAATAAVAVYFGAGLRYYLKLPRAWWLATAAALIATLSMLVAAIFILLYSR